MQIRPLGSDDYDAVLDLWRRSGLSSVRPTGRDSREAFSSTSRPDASPNTANGFQKTLGLFKGDELVGVIVVTHDGRKGWLNRLAVDPDHRRQGIARRLITAAEELLSRQGIHVIGALIESKNDVSLRLFRRVGYELHNDICYLSKRDRADA
jgi:ribosomal protein S18 acetylase RimI-like enzyme